MLNSFRKGFLSTALMLSAMSSSLVANQYFDQCCDPCADKSRFYVGAFGGGVFSCNTPRAYQYGTAFFPETSPPYIGPLAIIAEGNLNSNSTGYGGVQVGYEWSKPMSSGWSIAPAGELEYFLFRQNKSGYLINQTLVGLEEHDFNDSFRMSSNFILANAVISLNSDCLFGFSPYIGGGIGAARISLHNADSLQIEPVEAGINHFNSNPNDSTWSFAAQAKAGLRYNFCDMFHIFAEYRYIWVDASNFILGSTNYTTHVPTSPWNVKVKNVSYNAFAVGIQVDLY